MNSFRLHFRHFVRVHAALLVMGGMIALSLSVQSAPQGTATKKHPKPKPTEAPITIPAGLPAAQARESARLEAELALADSAKPYLVLDLLHRMLLIKLGGAVVWNHPLKLDDGDEKKISEFIVSLDNPDQHYVRHIKEKHLYSGKEQTPDSILSIVGSALKIDKSLLQREIPERFQLEFDDGFVMEFRSPVKGVETSAFRNTVLSVKNAFSKLFGGVYLVTTIDSTAAITLYRISEPGLPLVLAQ